MPAVYEPQQWPLAARVWLYRAGVSNTDIESLGIYYCTSLQRVVLPVKNDSGKIVYWQARTLDPTHPRKVLNPKADKSNLVFKEGTGPSVALTEDILSTVKLAKCGVESWALLGTKLSPYTAAKLIESRRPVIVALDSDRAGRSAAEVIIKQLRAYGCETYNVIFGRDPKLVPRDEIYGEFDRQGIKYAV
jgi:DNA primase